MKIIESSYKNFGRTLLISTSFFELHITLDIGPRIIHFSKPGMENMFYNDLNHNSLGEKQNVYDDIIKLYGGHRLWMSPEIMPDCYYPDNKPVKYEIDNNKIIFTPGMEDYTNLQKTITLITNEDNIQIGHNITNFSSEEKEIASWGITMFDKGGTAIFPIPDREAGYLHNKNFSFWSYTKLNDERLGFGNNYITLHQDPSIPDNFKLGYNNEHGYAIYFNKGQAFVKKFDYIQNEIYPDGGCNFETYTCTFMLEIETLSPLKKISPNGSISHWETWHILESDPNLLHSEPELSDFINKNIKPIL
ncbi:MAG: hypothetical protein LBV08_08475 [Clostridiales bacterium]|nr:hypothetical protein [Clostridiales bacterium]